MSKLTVLVCLLAATLSAGQQLDAVFQWKFIQYNWPSPTEQQKIKDNSEYIEANNAIAGIKLWKNKMYLTIPRWKSGVPVTLAVTSATPLNGVIDPKLDPYPNWDMQSLGNCNAFQSVQSMEIDPLGRMWVLDTGRTETMTSNPVTRCPSRLVILDLENNGTVLRTYEFPDDVAPKDSAYLNDIVLDYENGGMAFITDSGKNNPGIIVYFLKDNTSRKFKHHSMIAQTEAVNFDVAGTRISSPINVDGIALTTPGPYRLLYYTPLSSFHIYSIPVAVLKNTSVENIDEYVVNLGRKTSQTDGMIMSNEGILYFGLLADHAIAMWDSKKDQSLTTDVKEITRDRSLIRWPDTFAIDEEGQLWCVTNALQNFITDHVNISQVNYRVMRGLIKAKNYQYFKNGTAPELPVITGAANRINLSLSSCFTIILFFLAR